jgi:diguanylate cyclase (GGDEF)-like protein
MIGLVPFIVSDYLELRSDEDYRLSSIETDVSMSTLRAQATFVGVQQEIERLSQTIALSETITNIDQDRCKSKFSKLILIQDNIENAALLSPDGYIFCSTEISKIGQKEEITRFPTNSSHSSGVVWSDFVKDPNRNVFTIHALTALRSNGEVRYLLDLTLNTDFLRSLALAQFSIPLTQAFLLSSDGLILDGGPMNAGAAPLPPEALAEMARMRNGLVHEETFGIGEQVAAVATLPGTTNLIGFAVSIKEIRLNTKRIAYHRILLLVMVSLLTAAVLIFLLEWLLLRGLRQIVRVARRVAAGDHSFRVTSRSPLPELEIVSKAVNDMLDSLEQFANSDALTTLPNRRALDAHIANSLKRLARYGAGFTVVMIDIDLFKRFNDRYGHSSGDDVLAMIGRQLALFCRRTDEIAARYGGEEFALILTETNPGKVFTHCDNLRSAVESLAIPHPGSPHSVVTISVGFAAAEAGDSAPSAFTRADNALYKAKQNGRNRVEGFDPMGSFPRSVGAVW